MIVRAKWSVDEYHQMIIAGILSDRQVELINGEIIQMSPEGPTDRFLSVKIAKYLQSKLLELASVYESHPITLARSEPEPDIAVIKNPDTRYKERHPCPEDIYWLIEIADTTIAKDKEVKQKIYAEAGIAEYWIIDVNRRTLIIYLDPVGEKYQQESELSAGVITARSFPNINIEIEQLLDY